MEARTARQGGPDFLYSKAYRGLAVQFTIVFLLLALVMFFANNAIINTTARSIGLGFDFLWREAGFGIGQSVVAYSSTDSYAWAFAVGIINTIRVSALGIVAATILGLLIGSGSLSENVFVRRICIVYVEIFRNTPLLLQLYVWYSVILNLFPPEKAAFSIFSRIFISKAGLALPRVLVNPAEGTAIVVLLAVGLAGSIVSRRLNLSGRLTMGSRVRWASLLLILAVLAWIFTRPIEYPEFRRFGFVGGFPVSAEFAALAFGLAIYTASFIAEIVRAGILAVPHGQLEAATALGLTSRQALFLVRIPQSLRLIIPPLTSQYLNLTKNSSLAVAIGYADLVSVANTSLTQTARAIECITILIAVYLTLSLATSLIMNIYNRRIMARMGRS